MIITLRTAGVYQYGLGRPLWWNGWSLFAAWVLVGVGLHRRAAATEIPRFEWLGAELWVEREEKRKATEEGIKAGDLIDSPGPQDVYGNPVRPVRLPVGELYLLLSFLAPPCSV